MNSDLLSEGKNCKNTSRMSMQRCYEMKLVWSLKDKPFLSIEKGQSSGTSAF